MDEDIRLKLDRRIHAQRRALRENWMIVEQRARGARRFNLAFLGRFSAYLDKLGVPRGEGLAIYSIWKRLELAEALIATPSKEERDEQ